MKCLAERQVGFDKEAIGFPSIDGCHAIVLHTSSGLYGFHNYGGSTPAQFSERSQSFAAFVEGAFIAPGNLIAFYGTCFRNKRGYASDVKKGWMSEMRALAKAIKYRGKIKGYDLGKSDLGTKSAYVLYTLQNGQVSISYKPWDEMDSEKVEVYEKVNHKTTKNGSVAPITTKTQGNIKPKQGTGVMAIVSDNNLDAFRV